MPRPQLHDDTLAPAVVPGDRHTLYLVVRHRDEWFIKFQGQVYGPYKTEREAMRSTLLISLASAAKSRKCCRWTRAGRYTRRGRTDSTRSRPGNKHPLNEHWELHADFEA